MPKIETPGMFRERIAENFIVGETGRLAFQEGGKERIDSMIAERDAAIRAESAERERDAALARCAELDGGLVAAIKSIDEGGAHSVKRIRKMLIEVLDAIVAKHGVEPF